MLSLSGHSVYNLNVNILWFCLLAVSHAYVNVALNKPAYLQYPVLTEDNYGASNAVDGRKSDLSGAGGQCATSFTGQTATWWVNLTKIHSISHIITYLMTGNKRWGSSNSFTQYALGFSMYVSNTTDRLQGTLCYKDDNFTLNTMPAVYIITCPVHGQYVIYYNERIPGASYPNYYSKYAVSLLCEVEVYGCPGGFYGTDCSIACPDANCYCHPENGTCQGCKPGYEGYLCKLECSPGFQGALCKTQCDKGSFGRGCNETCGHCRDVNQCSHTNGTCLSGCTAGFKGNLCKTPCQSGFFGENCRMKCVTKCAGCNNVNGVCNYGCLPGFTGYVCQEACPYGLFGQNCSGECNDTCTGCNNVNGVCDRGCHPGWRGDYCDIGCESDWIEFKGHSYFFGKHTVIWSDAKMECKKMCSYLVKIEDIEEAEWLSTKFLKKENCSTNIFNEYTAWTGGNDINLEGEYVWDYPITSVIFTNWYRNEPSLADPSKALTRDCIDILRNVKWNDRPCLYFNSFICEKSFDL